MLPFNTGCRTRAFASSNEYSLLNSSSDVSICKCTDHGQVGRFDLTKIRHGTMCKRIPTHVLALHAIHNKMRHEKHSAIFNAYICRVWTNIAGLFKYA